jgi:hypothetical protein
MTPLPAGPPKLTTRVYQAWRRWDRWARQLKRTGVAQTKRGLKIGRHKSRNALVTAENLTRKSGRRIWALRKPILRWRIRAYRFEEQFSTYREEWHVERDLERAIAGSDPIVIGPWLSEVGYEVLYWIPFVRWIKGAYRLKPEQLIAVSRGGVASWYEDITSRYVEIFDHLDPGAFAVKNLDRSAAEGTVKQYGLSPLDEEILGEVKRTLGIPRVQVLHPSLMYRLFKQFWSGHRPLGFMDSHTRYARITPPCIADVSGLPAEYIAVKFYAARSMPDTPHIRQMLRDTIAALADQIPLVVLDTDLRLDDHDDYLFPSSVRAISARTLMIPKNNLGVQTQIIAGARAFVGTCGSVAWLAPMLGIDTMAVLADAKFLHSHLHVARRVYTLMKGGRFAPLDLSALEPLGLTLAVGSRLASGPAADQRSARTSI